MKNWRLNILCDFKLNSKSKIKLSACVMCLQIQDITWIIVYRRNEEGALNKYYAPVEQQADEVEIEWIEIVGYFCNRKILKVIYKLMLYSELLAKMQYQQFNLIIVNAIQTNKVITITNALAKYLEIVVA